MKEQENKEAKVQTENPIENEKILTEVEEKEEEVSNYIIIPDVTITRKVVKKSGKVYKDYFVNGTLRGVPMQVRVRPGKDSSGFTDVGAYNYLDVLFTGVDSVSFAVQTYRRRDTVTNRVTVGVTHHAYVKDENDGEEYAVPLRFETASDKAIITKFIEIANHKNDLGLPM